MADDGPAARVLRHKPNAAIPVCYRVQTAYPQAPQGVRTRAGGLLTRLGDAGTTSPAGNTGG